MVITDRATVVHPTPSDTADRHNKRRRKKAATFHLTAPSPGNDNNEGPHTLLSRQGFDEVSLVAVSPLAMRSVVGDWTDQVRQFPVDASACTWFIESRRVHTRRLITCRVKICLGDWTNDRRAMGYSNSSLVFLSTKACIIFPEASLHLALLFIPQRAMCPATTARSGTLHKIKNAPRLVSTLLTTC